MIGRSSTPRLFRFPSSPLEYWVARSSRAMTSENVADRKLHFVLCPKMREIWHFGRQRIMAGCLRQATKRGYCNVRSASDWHAAISEGDPARSHRAGAGVLQRGERKAASDLEADRAGPKRLRADADAD